MIAPILGFGHICKNILYTRTFLGFKCKWRGFNKGNIKNGIILIKTDTSINPECSIISLELLTQHATQMSHTAPRKVMHYIFGRDYIKTGSLDDYEVPRNSILSLKVMINFINGYLPCLK